MTTAQQAAGRANEARATALLAEKRAWFTMPSVGLSAMASPPTVTAGSASSMTSPFYYPTGSGDNSFPLTSNPSVDRLTYSRYAPTSLSGSGSRGISFMHEGSAFELSWAVTNTHYMIKVDDQYVTITPRLVASGTSFVKYDFGSVARRRIDIVGYNVALVGINIAVTDSLDPVRLRGPRCIVLGDSFTGGSGASGAQANHFVAAMADVLGWDDVYSCGSAGTGYLATNGGAGSTFRTRFPTDVSPFSPNIVFVAGSVNDDGFTAAAMSTEAGLFYSAIRSALPNALIFAGPNATGGPARWVANKLAVKAAMKAAAQAAGVTWVDPLEMPLGFVNGITPTALIAASSTAGATVINVRGTGATDGPPQPGGIIEIGSGATLERAQVKSFVFSFNGGYAYNITLSDPLQYAHAAGETWTRVGSSYITGKGKVGTTTGWGNSDLYVSSDGTHPSDAGHLALGRTYAMLMRQSVGR